MEEVMVATHLEASHPNLEEEAKDYIEELETELDEPLELDESEPPPKSSIELKPLPPMSTKASRQSTLGYTHGSSLSVDDAQATNLMVTQDTDKVFIQVWPPCGRNTYVLRLIVLNCVERIILS